MKQRLVGIDAGGTMTKVVLFDLQGNELACERQPNHVLLLNPGWVERDGEAMWQAVCVSLRALLEKTGTNPADIIAITPSGYGGGVYLVDRDGINVRNGVISPDTRSIPLIERWHASGLARGIIPEIESNIWPGQTFSLLAWFKENEPETFRRTAHVLPCKDFLRMRLCGDISTDPTDGGCAGIINVTRSDISQQAFAIAGMKEWLPKLPAVRNAVEIVGGISAGAAAATGLKEGTPVCRGVYDVVGCALATGVENDSQLAAVAGTFSIHSTLHRTPTLNPLPTIQVPYPVGSYVMATMATPTSASNLEWFVKTFMAAEKQQASARGQSVYDICNDLVAGTMAKGNDILFFPFLLDGPRGAPAGFTGMTMATGMADMLRAIYEGVACVHRMDMTNLLTGPGAAKPNVIRFAGGPSRSAVWAQMFTDCLGLPLEITNGSELGAKGAAMCGAVAAGAYSSLGDAMKGMVKLERRFTPDAARGAVLTAKYRRFLSSIETSVQAFQATRKAGDQAGAQAAQ